MDVKTDHQGAKGKYRERQDHVQLGGHAQQAAERKGRDRAKRHPHTQVHHGQRHTPREHSSIQSCQSITQHRHAFGRKINFNLCSLIVDYFTRMLRKITLEHTMTFTSLLRRTNSDSCTYTGFGIPLFLLRGHALEG